MNLFSDSPHSFEGPMTGASSPLEPWNERLAQETYSATGEQHYHQAHKPRHHYHHLPHLHLEHHDGHHEQWHPQHAAHIHRSLNGDAPPSESHTYHARHLPERRGYPAHEPPASTEEKTQMAALVAAHAREIGLSRHATVAAVAAMLQESGGNPTNKGDYDKHGVPRSFGLFMLNFRAGEGKENHLTSDQAKNPHINAMVALKYFKEFDNPNYSAGYLAKLAQRPSDPSYVRSVNGYVAEAQRLLDNA